MQIPGHLTHRPLEPSDARAVYEVMAAAELEDVGEVVIEEADIVADWQRPSYDLAASSVGVFDADRLVAYAEVPGPIRGDAAVHPDHRGRGIGTALAGWMQQTGRDQGMAEIGMPVPQGSPGDRLLAELGYRVRWTSWVLRLPAGATIQERPLPEGYAVRVARPEDHRDVWRVVEDAFLEWSVRERDSFADFEASVMRRPGFEPWHLRVVTDPQGRVVGVAFLVLTDSACCYIEKLAVDKGHRNQGLAQALLVDAFAAGRAHGATRSELATDSRTGALPLYERVGMVVSSTWVNRGIDLRAESP